MNQVPDSVTFEIGAAINSAVDTSCDGTILVSSIPSPLTAVFIPISILMPTQKLFSGSDSTSIQ